MVDVIDRYMIRIANDWISYFSSPETSRDDNPALFNPFMIVDLLVHKMDFYAWDLILLILQLDTEGKSLDLLSAATLETFVSAHGEYWIDQIEEQAKIDPRFRSLLAGIYQFDAKAEIWDRVLVARGNAIPFG